MGIVSGAYNLTELLFCHLAPVVAANVDEGFFFAETHDAELAGDG